MSIKQHPDKEPVLPPAPPPWGLLAGKGETAGAVRFALTRGTVSFPYHALARWELNPGPPEALLVQAGRELVTVRGRGLSVFRDALDEGSLLQVCVTQARYADLRTGPLVSSITIEALKNA